MAARTLRHYRSMSAVAANALQAVTPAVPATRALVISKLIVVNGGAATSFFIYIGPPPTTGGDIIAAAVPITGGEVYTEAGIVVLAGEVVYIQALAGANALVCNVFGEEVDN